MAPQACPLIVADQNPRWLWILAATNIPLRTSRIRKYPASGWSIGLGRSCRLIRRFRPRSSHAPATEPAPAIFGLFGPRLRRPLPDGCPLVPAGARGSALRPLERPIVRLTSRLGAFSSIVPRQSANCA